MIESIHDWINSRIRKIFNKPPPYVAPLPALRPLGSYYEYNGQLLHISGSLVGLVSAISVPLQLPRECDGIAKAETSFVLCDEFFTVELELARFHGPLREHRRTDIYRNGQHLFFEESGSRGFGSSFGIGKSIHSEGGKTYKIISGHELRRSSGETWQGIDPRCLYLLRFDDAVTPQRPESLAKKPKFQKTTYTRRELLPLRQPCWSAVVPDTPIGTIEVLCSEVTGFYPAFEKGRTMYHENRWLNCLRRTEIRIGAQVFVFE
jgi:hypothetical protein